MKKRFKIEIINYKGYYSDNWVCYGNDLDGTLSLAESFTGNDAEFELVKTVDIDEVLYPSQLGQYDFGYNLKKKYYILKCINPGESFLYDSTGDFAYNYERMLSKDTGKLFEGEFLVVKKEDCRIK